ncbi:MAG: hypothetical protein VXZ35_00565, partial [Pseudomonadota bacterium]|nr:hypothetical protein [Pseudomonadota bacterium]
MGLKIGKWVVLVVLFCSMRVTAEPLNHQLWDELLQSHVVVLDKGRATQVDYASLVQERERLSGYLTQLGEVPQKQFDGWPKS